jgi:hypothetical protein
MDREIAGALVVGLIALAVVALAGVYRRDQARIRALRASVFANCYDLFESFRATQRGIDFPVLDGRHQGREFRIEAIVDDLTFRKIPALWLKVSLIAPLPGMAVTDILVRSQNMEFYSPSSGLAHRLETPAGWPADAIVKTDNPSRAPDLAAIDGLVRNFYELPRAKEVLITGKGVRLVHLLDQGRRAEYLVLRQARFLSPAVAPELLSDLMDRCIALYEALRASGRRGEGTIER